MQRQLLVVAADLFRHKGYPGATTRELADLLGLKKASLYHYLKSKEDLLYDICVLSVDIITEEVSEAIDGVRAEERLLSAIRAHVRAAIRDLDMHAVMWTEFRYLDSRRQIDIKRRRAVYEQRLRDIVRQDQREGRLRSDVDPKHLTLMLTNLLNWTIFWFKPDGELSPKEIADLLAQQFIQGAGYHMPSSASEGCTAIEMK